MIFTRIGRAPHEAGGHPYHRCARADKWVLAIWARLRLDRIARVHLSEIDRKIADLSALRTELDRVIGSSSHGTGADCKIIKTLAPRDHE